jgi:hypothetical protein
MGFIRIVGVSNWVIYVLWGLIYGFIYTTHYPLYIIHFPLYIIHNPLYIYTYTYIYIYTYTYIYIYIYIYIKCIKPTYYTLLCVFNPYR